MLHPDLPHQRLGWHPAAGDSDAQWSLGTRPRPQAFTGGALTTLQGRNAALPSSPTAPTTHTSHSGTLSVLCGQPQQDESLVSLIPLTAPGRLARGVAKESNPALVSEVHRPHWAPGLGELWGSWQITVWQSPQL